MLEISNFSIGRALTIASITTEIGGITLTHLSESTNIIKEKSEVKLISMSETISRLLCCGRRGIIP